MDIFDEIHLESVICNMEVRQRAVNSADQSISLTLKMNRLSWLGYVFRLFTDRHTLCSLFSETGSG